jgi:hypothetical protein
MANYFFDVQLPKFFETVVNPSQRSAQRAEINLCAKEPPY